MALDISTSISSRVNMPASGDKISSIHAEQPQRQNVATLQGENGPFSNGAESDKTDPVSSSSSSEYDLKETVSNLNDFVQKLERNLNFSVDEVSGKTVITVTDPENDEVIRQIPSEELLAVARHYAELQESEGKGVLLEEKV